MRPPVRKFAKADIVHSAREPPSLGSLAPWMMDGGTLPLPLPPAASLLFVHAPHSPNPRNSKACMDLYYCTQRKTLLCYLHAALVDPALSVLEGLDAFFRPDHPTSRLDFVTPG
jgi:hypothetical protein